VGVAATACVPFGGDQHMLAESWQMMTTKRTAIRRRLTIRRTAYRPPWGGRKLGHGPIVAPLAATLAATVALGVGVAFARVERERRSSRKQRERERRFALAASETLGDGLRRIALGQLDVAIEALDTIERTGAAPGGAEHAVHETRKALKRLRALVHLLRDELGEKAFARESALLRDCARRLARARDAEVMVKTLEALLGDGPRKFSRRAGVKRLRARLAAERDAAAEAMLADHLMRSRVLGELRMFRSRVFEWRLADSGGIELVEPGLERLYSQGRRRLRRAARGSGERTRALHRWRKRVKDLRYVAEMLAPAGGGSAWLRRVGRRADELGELLGEEHDLAVLAELIRAQGKRKGKGKARGKRVGRATRRRLLKLIARRRKRLRKRALRDGERLYGRPAKKFVRRVRKARAGSSKG
jgi:CHAD domain-containing protein